jgi:hypothetical protein
MFGQKNRQWKIKFLLLQGGPETGMTAFLKDVEDGSFTADKK